MKTRTRPKPPATAIVTAAEARRRIIEEGRRRLEAEFAARGSAWAAAAPAWQEDYRNGGKERAEEEQARLVAERKERRAQEVAAEKKRRKEELKASREAWKRYIEENAEEFERLQREFAEERARIIDERYATPPWGSGGPFEVLGLTRAATLAQLKGRHRELALKHHPDRGGDAAEFRRIQAAYEVARRIIEAR